MSIAKSVKETIGAGLVVNLGQFVLYNDGTYRRLPNAKLIDIEFNEKHPGMLEFLVLEYKDGSTLKYKDGKYKASDAAGDAPKRRGRPPKAVAAGDAPKRRGRPPKAVAAGDAPKRRGRPPKAVAAGDAPKRRGRPPKAVLPEIKKPETPAKKAVVKAPAKKAAAVKAPAKKAVVKAPAKKAAAVKAPARKAAAVKAPARKAEGTSLEPSNVSSVSSFISALSNPTDVSDLV